MQNQQYNPTEHEWDFEQTGTVGIWYFNDWDGETDTNLKTLSNHFQQRADQSDILAAVGVLGDVNLPRETQQYISKKWSQDAEGRVSRIALVSDGITSLAAKSNIDAKSVTVNGFDTIDNAVNWAQQAE